jgi:hypothetical protein
MNMKDMPVDEVMDRTCDLTQEGALEAVPQEYDVLPDHSTPENMRGRIGYLQREATNMRIRAAKAEQRPAAKGGRPALKRYWWQEAAAALMVLASATFGVAVAQMPKAADSTAILMGGLTLVCLFVTTHRFYKD